MQSKDIIKILGDYHPSVIFSMLPILSSCLLSHGHTVVAIASDTMVMGEGKLWRGMVWRNGHRGKNKKIKTKGPFYDSHLVNTENLYENFLILWIECLCRLPTPVHMLKPIPLGDGI